MGKDPSDIRAEIEETRARVGDEVDALSYKTDVPARVGDYVDEKKQAVVSTATGAKDAVTGTVSRAVPSRRQLQRVRGTAEQNPVGLAIAGAAVGFVAGLLLPSTRMEDERFGETSDRVLDAAKETAADAAESGKQVAQQAASAATDAVREGGREQGQELASTLQERVQGEQSADQDSDSQQSAYGLSGRSAPSGGFASGQQGPGQSRAGSEGAGRTASDT